MKGYSVYNAIQQLKDQGFKKAAVARQLDINRRTVDRYWDMSVDEYEAMKSDVRRKQALDEYQQTILNWLGDYPSISSAQVCDWLKENYDAYFSERTVSRYVKELREEFTARLTVLLLVHPFTNRRHRYRVLGCFAKPSTYDTRRCERRID